MTAAETAAAAMAWTAANPWPAVVAFACALAFVAWVVST